MNLGNNLFNQTDIGIIISVYSLSIALGNKSLNEEIITNQTKILNQLEKINKRLKKLEEIDNE